MINTLPHLAYVLKVDLHEIEEITSNIDSYYYQKEEVKTDKDGNPKLKNGIPQKRILNPSLKKLKIIQKRIKDNLLNEISIPEYAFGGIKGKDNIKNAKKHQGKKYIFTTDLKDFYPSISHRSVFQMFRSFDFSPTVARCLTKLTTYKGRIPQGAPTSTIVSNLVFIKTGKKLIAFAKRNNMTFTSFVDDLTFSAPIDFKEKAGYIINVLQEDGYKISHKKTNYKTKNPIVTGIVVKNNKIRTTDAFNIKLVLTEGKSEQQLNSLKRYKQRVDNTNK